MEHLNYNNDKIISKRPQKRRGWGGVQAGSKEENFIGVGGGGGGGGGGAFLVVWLLITLKIYQNSDSKTRRKIHGR